MKALASEIRQAAHESGWSLSHILEEVGSTTAQLHQWENGTKARPKTAKKVRKGLQQYGIAPTATGFTSRNVSECSAEKEHDILVDLIGMILHCDNKSSVKLSAIRYLLGRNEPKIQVCEMYSSNGTGHCVPPCKICKPHLSK